MTVQELWREGKQILEKAGIGEAELDARYLLEWAVKQNYSFLLLHPSQEVEPEAEAVYRQGIQLRKNHKPLQYITGEQEFMGISFLVNEHVLIPRQDTEILVEAVLNHWKKFSGKEQQECRILDLCCGSGCIGLSIWNQLEQEWRKGNRQSGNPDSDRNHQWKVDLADISKEALAVTKKNAERLHAEVTLLESDLFQGIQDRYHILVSNPPYIPSGVVDTLMPEVREQEPRIALDGKEDGLFFYRNMIEQAEDYLEDEGYVFFEIGFNQAEDVRKILVDAGFEQIVVRQDLAGLDRVISARKRHKEIDEMIQEDGYV